jgi:hypothetical protein
MVYTITAYTKNRAKQAGLEVKPSTKQGKKLDVYKDGKFLASVGASAYGDYSTFLKEKGADYADERRRLYHIRHKNNNGLEGTLAKVLLW